VLRRMIVGVMQYLFWVLLLLVTVGVHILGADLAVFRYVGF